MKYIIFSIALGFALVQFKACKEQHDKQEQFQQKIDSLIYDSIQPIDSACVVEKLLVMDRIDYKKVSSNKEVIQLIKKREELERKIKNLDKMALVKYELEVLAISD